MKISSLTFIIITTASLGLSTQFLLNDDCPVLSPCTCSGSSAGYYIYINCNSKSLTNIPHIKQFSNNVYTLNLYFYSNNLTFIPNNAFWNFSSINASNIDLLLYSNKIHTIESNAFNGIENVTSLQLQNNNITALPLAFRHLVKLRSLNVQSNPLQTLDASAMSNIGRTLKSFSLDLNHFTEWPQELHYLRKLQTLTANHIPFIHLDINAFHGFETTLTTLTLVYSKLEKVPYAICHLSHLTSLIFMYDSNLKENKASIFEPCGRNLSTVTRLYLGSNNIHTFPNIFTLFPSLTYLNLDNNKLEYIESTKIPVSSSLTTIQLENNLFDRIPYALNGLKHLTTINIEQNKIKIIDSPDLAGLSNLNRLSIYSNPITYIAPNAFKHNVQLHHLDLDYTHLDHVPVAVTNLTRLSTFYLSGIPINCSCDMSYLKHWNVSALTTFNTKCSSSSTETIKSFILNSLQSCP